MSKIFDFELKLKKLWRKMWGWGKIKLHKILENKCLFIPMWFPMCPLWVPYGTLLAPNEVSVTPLVLYGPPTSLQWPPLTQYGPLWTSYGSRRVRYDAIWTQMSPFWLLNYTCRPYIGSLYWQSGFLLPYGPYTFHMTNFGTIDGP